MENLLENCEWGHSQGYCKVTGGSDQLQKEV